MSQVTCNRSDVISIDGTIVLAVCILQTLCGRRIRNGRILRYITGQEHNVVDLNLAVAVNVAIQVVVLIRLIRCGTTRSYFRIQLVHSTQSHQNISCVPESVVVQLNRLSRTGGVESVLQLHVLLILQIHGTDAAECSAVSQCIAIRSLAVVAAGNPNFLIEHSGKASVVLRSGYTNVITTQFPLSVEELLCQVQSLAAQRSSICTDLAGLCTYSLRIVDQGVSQRRYTAQVGATGCSNGAGQTRVCVLIIGTSPCSGLTGPIQSSRDCVIAVIGQSSILNEPSNPSVEELAQCIFNGQTAGLYSTLGCISVSLYIVVQLSQTLCSPYLVADPVVGTRVSIYRMLNVSHIIECGYAGGVGHVVAVPAVGCTACERTVSRLEPLIEFQLSLERSGVVLGSALSLHCRVQAGIIQQSVCCQRALIELVSVAAADLPSPGAILCAAPGSVPCHQVVAGVITGGGAVLVLTADCLVVLIEHVVTQFVTHLTSKCGNGAVAHAPLVCCVNSLDCTVFCVRCVGVGPLCCNVGIVVEYTLDTTICHTILQSLDGRMRYGLKAGLGVTSLEGVDEGELTGGRRGLGTAVVCPTVAVPVIYVRQPVHQVQTIVARVCRGEFAVDRVGTCVRSFSLYRVSCRIIRYFPIIL